MLKIRVEGKLKISRVKPPGEVVSTVRGGEAATHKTRHQGTPRMKCLHVPSLGQLADCVRGGETVAQAHSEPFPA